MPLKMSAVAHESDAITEDFIAGRTDSIHSVMIAGTKASLALDFMIEVRNKIMDAIRNYENAGVGKYFCICEECTK